MKNLQFLYNEDVNKIMELAAQERAIKENLFFLIDLATITMVTEDPKPMEDEPQMFNETLICKRPFKRISLA